MASKLAKSGWSVCVAAVAALVGIVFYLITSTTGFLAGTAMNPLPILCAAGTVVLALVLMLAGEKLNGVVLDLVVVAATLLIIAGFALFALGRVNLVADVYFIPVNYPKAEATALNLSIVGLGCYLVSILSMLAASFSGKLSK